jgi:hypothetical protein
MILVSEEGNDVEKAPRLTCQQTTCSEEAAKISAVLEWLDTSNDAGDDDLVVMMDAYGQLRSLKANHRPRN